MHACVYVCMYVCMYVCVVFGFQMTSTSIFILDAVIVVMELQQPQFTSELEPCILHYARDHPHHL